MRRTVRSLLPIVLAGLLSTGCVFSLLGEDLGQLDDVAHLFTGEVSMVGAESHRIVVVAKHDLQGEDIASYRMLGSSGVFEIRGNAVPT